MLCVTVAPVVSSLVHLHVVRVDLYAFDISIRMFVWNILSCVVDMESFDARRLFLTVMSW